MFFFCFLLLLLRSVNQWTVQCFSFIFDSIPIFRHILIASTKWFESLFFFACPKTPLLSHKRSVLCIQISIFPSFFFVCSHIFRFCTSKSLQNRLIYACLCPPILQLYMSEPSSFRFVHTHKKTVFIQTYWTRLCFQFHFAIFQQTENFFVCLQELSYS